MLVAFYKPYGVLTRFTPDGSAHRTLAEYDLPGRVHPIGRLDADSEGLLLLSDEKVWENKLLNPGARHWRTYWVQVERIPSADALKELIRGVEIAGYRTRPAKASLLKPAPLLGQSQEETIYSGPEKISIPLRHPPIRFRKNVPDSWISLSLTEGKNRQVRKMTAAVGHPTLRLIRFAIGGVNLSDLALRPGQSKLLGQDEERLLFG